MKLSVLTLFPEYFEGMVNTSITKRAIDEKSLEFETVNYRDFAQNKHRHVDDTPYGGGQGMVLQCQPLIDGLRSVQTPDSHVVLLSPQGKPFNQEDAERLSKEEHVILICGHYEGFDERIRLYADEQLSLGDFVMTGGEPAAAAMSDAIIRLLPGVIRESSHEDDSFQNHLLEYPQYTKPYDFEGHLVPDVLLSGHHANIEAWRRKMSLLNTAKHRPDLLEKADLLPKEREWLEEMLEKEVEDGQDKEENETAGLL